MNLIIKHANKAPISNNQGFGLIEVLVSLIIIAVGLLGIAKIQALAYAETSTASSRSIAAIEASSLAASMRANRAYWSTAGSVAGGLNITVVGTGPTTNTLTSNDPAAPSAPAANACLLGGTSAPCTPVNLAAYDLKQWGNALNSVLGANYTATITCPTITIPITCTIVLNWTERLVGAQATNGSAMITPTYILYVEP